jgi:histidinol phosphatase-like PHP family hydrolase/calcineurin-like phosphoesterase family protein
MSTKIAILTDFHYSEEPNQAIPNRKGEFADILLLRAVHRLNRFIKPDLVFIGGDMINEPDAPDAEELLRKLKDILDLLDAPYIIIPGNHDPAPEKFYHIFPKPETFTDINNVRFVTFCDPEEPGYNARRLPQDLELLKQARTGFSGQLVSLQHVPLLPEVADCPYNYVNKSEILHIMRENGYSLSISGHFHYGLDPLEWHGINFITGKAICETPLPYAIVELEDDGKMKFTEEFLSMPTELNLTDSHIHTHLAYCNENMDIQKTTDLIKLFGLQKGVISEHSAHLYFNRPDYSARKFYSEGINSKSLNDRTDNYFQLYTRDADKNCRLGMEIDIDKQGLPVIETDIWNQLQFSNGAVHYMDSIASPENDNEEVIEEFLALTEAVLQSGVNALAHPFRIFRRNNRPIPSAIFPLVVGLLQKYGAAAEINFHTNEPPAEFFKMCIKNGVPLALGSDSHNLYEVGEFYPHLKLLDKIAPNTDYKEILLNIN